MMDRIINMVIRQVTRKLVGQGVNAAMKAGGKAMKRRGKRGGEPPATLDFVEPRRRRHADERRGDEILYPTDDYTEDMQPRR